MLFADYIFIFYQKISWLREIQKIHLFSKLLFFQFIHLN